jgi:hypothetical protein
MERITNYAKTRDDCQCRSWCRSDFSSGFTSLHHATCSKFDAHIELHIMNAKIMALNAKYKQKENQNTCKFGAIEELVGKILTTIEE